MHLGTAITIDTIAKVRNDWWIRHLRAKVKRIVKGVITAKCSESSHLGTL